MTEMKKNDGQTILVLLLIITVIMTLSLSIAYRSVTDVKMTQRDQEATRAFWVAQAGIEKAIAANAGVPLSSLNNIDYTVVRLPQLASFAVSLPDGDTRLEENQTTTVWLVGHNEDTGDIDWGSYYDRPGLSVFWGNAEDSFAPGNDKPAIEATLLYKTNAGSYKLKKFTFDPDATRVGNNNFALANSNIVTVDDRRLAFNASINFALVAGDTPVYIRYRLLYNQNPQVVAVTADDNAAPFPSQGVCYESTATVPESGVTKRLSECRSWKASLPIFDNVLFSGVNL